MRFNNIHKSYLARFFRDLQFFSAVSVPYFLDWLQIDYTRMFILQAWFAVWIVLLEVPTGIVADKFGRKVSLSAGMLLFGIDLLIFGLSRNYYLLYLAEFIGALGYTLISGADKALIYDSLIEMNRSDEGKYYLSRYEAAGTFGLLVSMPLGSLIAGAGLFEYPLSLAVTFILSGLFSILSVFLYLSMKEPARQEPTESFVSLGIEGTRYLLQHKILRKFAFNSVVLSSISFFMFWFYQPLADHAGIDIMYFGLIGAGANLLGTVLLLNVKKLEDTFGMRHILFYTALIPGVFFLGLALIKNAYFVVMAVLIIIGLNQIRTPILSDFMNQYIESRNRATVLSSVSLVERILIAVLYPIIGIMADITLPHTLVFLGVLALVFTFITKIEAEYLS